MRPPPKAAFEALGANGLASGGKSKALFGNAEDGSDALSEKPPKGDDDVFGCVKGAIVEELESVLPESDLALGADDKLGSW